MTMKLTRWIAAALCAGLLAACGGGGGSPGSTSNGGGGTGTTPPATPASVEVFTTANQLSSSSTSTVGFTVVVKDANNQAVPQQTVTFSASSGNLSGALPAPKTGAAGEAVTGVTLSPGSDASNRDIVVTVSAGGASKTVTIPVVGSALTLSGDPSIILGGTTTFTVKATDSGGRALSGVPITPTSSLGNGLSSSPVTTDAQGAATFVYSANKAGLDTLSVTGLGATANTTVAISADDFKFESPASGASVAVGSNQGITVRYLAGGVAVAGQQVTFSSTRGIVTPETATTDANGRASATLSSLTSGPATVIAQAGNAQATLPIAFVATTPASVVLQANPGSLPPNPAGSTASQATLQAIVRDASGNPVTGRVVNFSAITDGSNGVIAPGSGTTDANGTVVVQFIPGALTTASNGVVLRASVQGTSVTGTASLTVSGQALFISIGTGNEIGNLNPTTYEKDFTVYVTDANGAPVANRVVNLAFFPDAYAKGTLSKGEEGPWDYTGGTGIPAATCTNEDLNRNGILNPGEDTNGDGLLTPGLPVVVSPANVTTDANGFASFSLHYGENYVPWLAGTITARATVGGTESVQTFFYPLKGAAPDFTGDTPPAGERSPFGVSSSCQDPN